MCDDEAEIAKQKEFMRAEVRRKILMLGKLSKLYGDIQVERMAAVKLRGLTKSGAATPQLLRAVTDGILIGDFKAARKMDLENEKRPPVKVKRRKSLMDMNVAALEAEDVDMEIPH